MNDGSSFCAWNPTRSRGAHPLHPSSFQHHPSCRFSTIWHCRCLLDIRDYWYCPDDVNHLLRPYYEPARRHETWLLHESIFILCCASFLRHEHHYIVSNASRVYYTIVATLDGYTSTSAENWTLCLEDSRRVASFIVMLITANSFSISCIECWCVLCKLRPASGRSLSKYNVRPLLRSQMQISSFVQTR